VLDTGKQTPEQTGETARSSAAAIRFSGADGRVLSWTATDYRVRIHSRLHRELLHRAPAATAQTDSSRQEEAPLESYLRLESVETKASKTPRPDRAWAAYLAISLLLAAFVVVCWVSGAI
jgi:hypothetical protein